MDETQVVDTADGVATDTTQLMDTQLENPAAPKPWGSNFVSPKKQVVAHSPIQDDEATPAPDDYDDDATQAPEDDDDGLGDFAGATMQHPHDDDAVESDDDATQAPPESPEPVANETPEATLEVAPEEPPTEVVPEQPAPEMVPDVSPAPPPEPQVPEPQVPEPAPAEADAPELDDADDLEVVDAMVDAVSEPSESHIDGVVGQHTVERIDTATEVDAFETEKTQRQHTPFDDAEETQPFLTAQERIEKTPEKPKVGFALETGASPDIAPAGGAWRAAGTMVYDTQMINDTQVSSEPVETPVEAPVEAPAEAPVEAPVEAPAAAPVEVPVEAPAETPVAAPVEVPEEVAEDAAAPMETDADETPAPHPAPAYSAEELRSMKFGRDAVPSRAEHSMLEGAVTTDGDATEVALSAEEKEDTQTETAEKDDESAGDDFPASAPSHPTVAMPVVRDLIPPTPITLDEPEGSDDDLEDCGGEWMRGLPPPPPTQPPVDAEADDAPTELSEPTQTRGTVATQETTTTAATIQDGGTRGTARASIATAETVVTRPRRAAANATASTAAAETAAKPKKAVAEQVKPTTAEQTKANAKAPAKQAPEKSKPIQRRGRAAVMPDETQEAAKPKKAAVEQVAPTSAAKAKTPAKAPATRAPEKTRPTSKRGRAAVGTEETQDDTPGRMTKTQKAAVETVAPTSAAKAKAPAKRAPAKPKPTSKRGRAAVSPDDKQDDTHDTKKSKTRRGGEPFGSVKKKEFCVLVSTAFDPETAEKLTRKVLKLGGVCTVSSSEFTHFLTAPPLGRSKNVLSALASGSPVVLPSWLDASVRISHLPHSAD